ncbi:MAG TPA: glycosyltransferase family 2 protein [Candidatus Binatia bacterium]|nr:glycosyltransferase family 2 protein [Candidatus Binatia bacterium]
MIAAEAGDAIPSAGEDLAPEVSFVIVTCDRRELLAGCLESIAALDYPGDRVEIVVYDNGSRDGTRDWLARARRDVRVVAGTANAGFAAPNNRAADVAAGRLLCLVNNDVRVGPDFLRELVDARAATGAACVGARVLSADGTAIEFDGGTMSFYGHAAPHRHGERADEPAADAPPVPTLFASGAAMLVDRAAFRSAGGFDESYFAYFEDADLGWRLWALGERCVLAPRAGARHAEHGSEALLSPGRRIELLEQNALLTVYKNYEGERADRVFRCALALLAERARLEPSRAAACERGLAGAVARLPFAEGRRRELAERRVRSDAEIAPLFLEPFRPAIAGEAYAERQREIAALFDAADLFAGERIGASA